LYTYKCNGIVNEFSSKNAALSSVIRHRKNSYVYNCHGDHEIFHCDKQLSQTDELTFIGLGFTPNFIDGLTRPERKDAVQVPGEFFFINKKWLTERARVLVKS
jgi:hypothetical protein